jgi:hypothetical protein
MDHDLGRDYPGLPQTKAEMYLIIVTMPTGRSWLCLPLHAHRQHCSVVDTAVLKEKATL